MSGYSITSLYSTPVYYCRFRKSTHMIMASVRTLMVVQSFLSTIADALDCVATTHRQVIADWACQPFEYKDIIYVPYHHCSMTCIHNYECQAFIYDKIRQSCMMLSKPCMWLQPHTSHIYQKETMLQLGAPWYRLSILLVLRRDFQKLYRAASSSWRYGCW